MKGADGDRHRTGLRWSTAGVRDLRFIANVTVAPRCLGMEERVETQLNVNSWSGLRLIAVSIGTWWEDAQNVRAMSSKSAGGVDQLKQLRDVEVTRHVTGGAQLCWSRFAVAWKERSGGGDTCLTGFSKRRGTS